MKNCSRPTTRLPSAMTRIVSVQATTKVAKLKSAFRSGAKRRAPKIPSTTAPPSGIARRSANSMLRFLLQRFEMVQIETLKTLTYLEEKHSEHQHRNQHVECHAEFDHHRHAVGRAHCRKEKTVLHRQKANDLRHGFLAR